MAPDQTQSGISNDSRSGNVSNRKLLRELIVLSSIKSLLWTAPTSFGITLLLNRYNPRFRKMRFPFKAIVAVIPPIAYSAFRLDQGAVEYNRDLISHMKKVNNDTDPGSGREVSREDKMKEFVKNNWLKLVFGTWSGVVAAVLLRTWKRRDLSTGQKFISARVAAQIAALTALGSLAYVFRGDGGNHLAVGTVPTPKELIAPNNEGPRFISPKSTRKDQNRDQ